MPTLMLTGAKVVELVVCNQIPAELTLEPTAELNVKADRVSLEYRRWLRELAGAGRLGGDGVAAVLGPREAPCAI